MAVPIHGAGEEDSRFLTLVQIENGPAVDFMIDTGAEGTFISTKVASLLLPSASAVTEPGAIGLHGYRSGRVLLEQNLQLQGRVQPNWEFITDRSQDKPEGHLLLGMNILSRFRITLDYRNRQMLLEPASDYTERSQLCGQNIIELGEDPDYVDYVEERSAADKAGVRRGDKIIAIDGRQTQAISGEGMSKLLAGNAGTVAHLLLQRAKVGQVEVSYERPSRYRKMSGKSVK